MAAAADSQMDMGIGQFQVLEKGVRHVDVVMLTGVDDYRIGPGLLFQGMVERGDLHEVGPGRGDQMNFHGL